MPDHAISTDPAVQAQLDRLTMLSPGKDILGLERITSLLDRLGNPHRKLPPIFHVAGTNGKGSTCAFLRGAMEAAGLTVHVYSSPHLVRFNERIRVAGLLIDDVALSALLAEVLDHAEGLQASFFEVTTAVAFLAFARTPADACVIEVGLGGRLDATNVLATPVACGIASLGLDHEAFLLAPEDGVPDMAPLDRIAFEKAGIAKSGSPLVTQKYSASMADTVAAQATLHVAVLHARRESWDAATYDGRLHYRDAAGKLSLPLPRMTGAHQADNAALAVAMLRHQSAIHIPEAALAAAMEWTRWPARMQPLAAGPLTDLLPTGSTVWLDGGHNPDAGAAIAKTLEDGPPFILWLGMGRALLISGLMMMFSNVMFMLLAATGNNYWMMVAAICTENLTSGIGLTVFATYLSGLSSIAYTATQFALLSSFAGVGRTFMAGPAGIVAENVGWVGFWGFTVVAAIPGMILLWVLWAKGYVVQSIHQVEDVNEKALKEPVGPIRIIGFLLVVAGLIGLLLSQPLELATNLTWMFAAVLVAGGLLAWKGQPKSVARS